MEGKPGEGLPGADYPCSVVLPTMGTIGRSSERDNENTGVQMGWPACLLLLHFAPKWSDSGCSRLCSATQEMWLRPRGYDDASHCFPTPGAVGAHNSSEAFNYRKYTLSRFVDNGLLSPMSDLPELMFWQWSMVHSVTKCDARSHNTVCTTRSSWPWLS